MSGVEGPGFACYFKNKHALMLSLRLNPTCGMMPILPLGYYDLDYQPDP